VLRESRIKAGKTASAAASYADVTPGTLSKYENGENPIPVGTAKLLAEHYGLAPDVCTTIMEMARGAKQRGWWQKYQEIPDWFSAYVSFEAEASTLRNYEDGLIPGLLQSPDYARALVKSEIGISDLSDSYVSVRMQRQERLLDEQRPLRLSAVVNEASLLRRVGGRDVMKDQLKLLIERASLPNVDLRVLPFDMGGHAAIAGSFAIMGFESPFPSIDFEDIVYVEYKMGALYLEEGSTEVSTYSAIFDSVQASSLNPDESIKYIQQVLDERF
jgi:transcriptional regulator with XRE-family HTH domain